MKARAKKVLPDMPPFPWALVDLWDLFLELALGVGSNGMGPPVVTWLDVEAFDRAADHGLSPWEKRALVRLGSVRASVMGEEMGKHKPKPAAPKPKRK